MGAKKLNKLFLSIVMVITLLLASACTANTESTPEQIDVDILLPERISLNQESVLKVQVSQGKEKVEDAEDVQFEIWKANSKEDSELIHAQHGKGGIYHVKKTFREDGIYYVQTHVAARGLHVMPKKQFVVGKVSEEDLNSLIKESQNPEPSHGHHH
jgi:hypothetical protein